MDYFKLVTETLKRPVQRIVICAWCEREIARYDEPWEPKSYESHGICAKCNEKNFGRIIRYRRGER